MAWHWKWRRILGRARVAGTGELDQYFLKDYEARGGYAALRKILDVLAGGERPVNELVRELGLLTRQPTTAYLVGGTTAVLEGWRQSTIDVDLRIEPAKTDAGDDRRAGAVVDDHQSRRVAGLWRGRRAGKPMWM